MSSSGFLKKFTKLFPVPKDLSFDFVGIDFCRDSIKVVKLEDTKYGKIPKMFKEYSLEQQCGLMQLEPEYVNCEEALNVLRQIKKEFKVDYANISHLIQTRFYLIILSLRLLKMN
jgi:hypothetical protein